MRHHRPKQTRSEATLERIVAAAHVLFAEHRTVDVPVIEVCQAAEASRSSFYARFPDTQSFVHVCYERFSESVRVRCGEIENEWSRIRPGGNDFDSFVPFIVDRHLCFWNERLKLVQAFRAGERGDSALIDMRETLDQEILSMTIATACHHYRDLDGEELSRRLQQEMAVIAAAFRGAVDFPDWVAFVSEESRQKLIAGLSALVLRSIGDTSPPPVALAGAQF